nr:hypothetical protein [Tanacetum cinerariifolium]
MSKVTYMHDVMVITPPPNPISTFLPADASLTALSPGYIADLDPDEDLEKDLKEDPKEDPDDYPFDRGDEENEEDDDEEEEEEHLALTDSFVLPIDDPTPMVASTEALIATVVVALPSSTPPPSPLTSYPSPLPKIPLPPVRLPPSPIPPMASPLPLSFLPSPIRPTCTRAAMVPIRAVAPSTNHSLLPSGTPVLLPIPLPLYSVHIPPLDRREIISEANMSPRKRLLLTAPTLRFEIGESLTVVTTRQPGSSVAYRADYSFVDIRSRDSNEFYTRHQDASDDCAAVRAEIEDADDRATIAMMRIYVLEDRAHIDTLEDTDSSV